MPDNFGAAPRERRKRFFKACEAGDLNKIRQHLSPDLINHVELSKDVMRIPIHICAERGHFDSVLFLVENGCAVDALDERLSTACIKAVVNHHYSIAELLASHGADIRHEDAFGRCAFLAYDDPLKAERLRVASTYSEHRDD